MDIRQDGSRLPADFPRFGPCPTIPHLRNFRDESFASLMGMAPSERLRPLNSTPFIDLTEGDEVSSDENFEVKPAMNHAVPNLKTEKTDSAAPKTPIRTQEGNEPLVPPWVRVTSHCQNTNIHVEENKCYELISSHGEEVILVLEVWKHLTKQVDGEVRGLRFRRQRAFGGMLKKSMNEIVLVVDVVGTDRRPFYIQALERFRVTELSTRRELIITDCAFPEKSFRDAKLWPGWSQKSRRDKFLHGPLVCRKMYQRIYATAHDKKKIQRIGGTRHLVQEVLHDIVPSDWRPGYNFCLPSRMTVLRADNDPAPATYWTPSTLRLDRKLRYVDGFCGAGGAARAAHDSGLDILLGLDIDTQCIESFKANFPQAATLKTEIGILGAKKHVRNVDVLHLSPPCQFFSPAHTLNGPNDERNEAALFSVGAILERLRPRILTCEQTPGLFQSSEFEQHFKALIGMITDHSYNVRWGIVSFEEYGLCQMRKRLIIVASARGVPLPEFPRPTHGPRSPFRFRFHTIRNALDTIPDGASLQNLATVIHERRYPPTSPDTLLRKLITCRGDTNWHHNGERTYTLRELASLQGFPSYHEFAGTKTQIKRQIGNAVPPSAWSVFVRQIKSTLQEFDRGGEGRGHPALGPQAIEPTVATTMTGAMATSTADHDVTVPATTTPLNTMPMPANAGNPKTRKRSAPPSIAGGSTSKERKRSRGPVIIDLIDEEDDFWPDEESDGFHLIGALESVGDGSDQARSP